VLNWSFPLRNESKLLYSADNAFSNPAKFMIASKIPDRLRAGGLPLMMQRPAVQYYAASQDPMQQPFGHVVLGTKPGIVRVVAVQAENTGNLTSPAAVGPSAYNVQNALWNENFTWFGHYYPPGYRASAMPSARAPQFAFPGSASGNGGMPHMRPPSFNTGCAQSDAGYFFNW
jgi:hypothetical protein